MSTLETTAPKSMLDSADGEMGVMVIWEVIVMWFAWLEMNWQVRCNIFEMGSRRYLYHSLSSIVNKAGRGGRLSVITRHYQSYVCYLSAWLAQFVIIETRVCLLSTGSCIATSSRHERINIWLYLVAQSPFRYIVFETQFRTFSGVWGTGMAFGNK